MLVNSKVSISKRIVSFVVTISILFSCIIYVSAAEYTSGDFTYTVTDKKAKIISYTETAKGDVDIPSSLGGYPVTEIGANSFGGCTLITSVNIPNTVTSIETYAFAYCTSLSTIIIPSSVTSIGINAFKNSNNVKFDCEKDSYAEKYAKDNDILIVSGSTNWGKTYKKDGSFRIITKQSDYNEGWFELKGVDARIGSTIISQENTQFKIEREQVLNNGSSPIVLRKSGFEDYLIPNIVARSIADGDNFDAYMNLSKKNGKPYISTVFGKNSSAKEYQDLFKTPIVAEIDNTYDIIISAVGLDSDATYYIAQDFSHKIKSKTGYFTSKDLYSNLTLNKAVYVYAIDGSGHLTNFETINLSKSTDDGSLKKMLEMSTYSLGGSGGITIKVPDENPIFGNSEISLNAFSAPITVYYDSTNNTYIGTIGFDFYNYTKQDKTVSNASGSLTKFGDGETKKAFQNFKESFGYFNKKPFAEDKKDKEGKSYREQWNSFVNRCKTASSYSQKYYDKNFSVDFLGYIEFAITDQGFTIKEAELKVGTKFSYSYTYQGAVWVIPAYFKATLGAEASLEASGKRAMVDKSIPFEYEITLDIEPKLALEAGIGVEKLAKAGVEAKGTAPIKVEFFDKHFKLDFHGEINIKTKAFIFSWDKKLLEGDLNIVNKYWGKTKKTLVSTQSGVPQYKLSTNADGTAKLVEYYNESSSVLERDYLEEMSPWYGNVSTYSRVSSMSDIDIKQLQTSVLEDGKPAIINVGDKVLMAWIEDCAERDSYNRMRLVYSVYDGSTWSEPVAVYDDGKNDDAPVLATDGSNVYFAWQKINGFLDENSVVTEALQQVDICIATYSSATNIIKDAKIICTGNGYDYSQAITVENGKPVIYFASCADPSAAVSFNSKINKWSDNKVETLVSSLSFVQSISADGRDMSYVLDTDGDLATSSDINVFSYSDNFSTAYDKSIETALVGSYYGEINDEKVMFVTDGANIYYDLDGERKKVFSSAQNLSSLNLIELNGKTAFMWTEYNDIGNSICYSYYDGSEWTSPVVIYQAEGYCFDSLDMIGYNDGIIGGFMQGMLTYNQENEEYEISQVNLAYITITDYSDISVGCITADEETLIPGESSELCVYIENKGTLHLNNVDFIISDSIDDAQIVSVDVDLAPGENKNVYIDYAVPEEFRQTILVVTAATVNDSNSSNNSAETMIGLPDLGLITCDYIVNGDYFVVTANVRNDSITAANDITAKLYLNDSEGDLFYESKIKSLASDEIGIVQFYVEKDLLIFDETNTARMFCWFEDGESKFRKTVTECILVTKTTVECGHPVTEERDKINATTSEIGHEAGTVCVACGKYVSGGEIIDIIETITPVTDDIIKQPSQTMISYGDSIILHIDAAKIPVGGIVEWTALNGNFDMEVSADGMACKISPSLKGDTTFTATVYDANGNVISSDEQVMTSKASFFYKIIAFFKKIFGLTKVILQ